MNSPPRPSFGDLLRAWRGRVGKSASEVSSELPGSKNSQYVAGLERSATAEGKATLPSHDSLKELLLYFSDKLAHEPDGRFPSLVKEALQSIWGVDLDLVPGIGRELDRHIQNELGSDMSVWLVADRLAEDRLAEDADMTGAWIRTVATAIYGRGVKYIYFLPFSKLEENCRLLGESIRAEAARQGLDTSVNDDRLQIYQLSDVAFTARMRLVLPRPPEKPYGHMAVTDKDEVLRVAMPRDVVEATVERLNVLMRNLKDGLEGNPKVGLLRKVFPA